MHLIFLILAFITGYLISCRIKRDGNILEMTAMGIGTGYLVSGWTAYLSSYAAKLFFHLDNPMTYGNVVTMSLMVIISIILLRRYGIPKVYATDKKACILFAMLFFAILGSMFYVFYVKDGLLYSGSSVFSDYAPHTAMIRSFSYHDNFPTQYPHYGGEDVRYHFMFQFLAGNLEYLGMRIDWAFNLISAASLWGCLVLLYHIAQKIAGTCAAVITIFMFFCRSSFAVFEKIYEAITNGDLSGLLNNAAFIGYTTHEDWGLWNYNVFLNQRHFGFGLLIAMIVISYYIDRPGEGNVFFTKEAWACKDVKIAAVMGILLGAAAFWNGAVVIGALFILFGIAIFSKNKLDFAVTAAITILLSVLQAKVFTTNGVGISFQFGFLASSTTIVGVLKYIFQLSGIFFVGIAIFLCCFRKRMKVLIFAFMLPMVFAFSFSMTPDITVNHKYIIISVIFLNILWGYALSRMFRHGFLVKMIAGILLIVLTATGAYDLLTIYNENKSYVTTDLDSSLTAWLREHITEDDLVLVNYDYMSEVSMAGVMMYNAWPYYAWSAGYDTDVRDSLAQEIYGETDTEKLKEELKAAGIDYIVIEDGNINPTTISQVCECVFDEDGDQVYQVPAE